MRPAMQFISKTEPAKPDAWQKPCRLCLLPLCSRGFLIPHAIIPDWAFLSAIYTMEALWVLRCYKIPLVLRLCHYKNAPPTQHRLDRVLKALDKFPPCPSFYIRVYSFWYKHGYLIVPRCYIFLRVFAKGRYTLFSKLLYHLSFKASKATHQTQMFKRSATKVSEEDCQSGLNKSAAIMEISNALSIKTRVPSSFLNLMRISMISLFSVFCFALPPIQNYSISLEGSSYRARFSKVSIIYGPGKLSPFALKIEVSIVLHLPW